MKKLVFLGVLLVGGCIEVVVPEEEPPAEQLVPRVYDEVYGVGDPTDASIPNLVTSAMREACPGLADNEINVYRVTLEAAADEGLSYWDSVSAIVDFCLGAPSSEIGWQCGVCMTAIAESVYER